MILIVLFSSAAASCSVPPGIEQSSAPELMVAPVEILKQMGRKADGDICFNKSSGSLCFLCAMPTALRALTVCIKSWRGCFSTRVCLLQWVACMFFKSLWRRSFIQSFGSTAFPLSCRYTVYVLPCQHACLPLEKKNAFANAHSQSRPSENLPCSDWANYVPHKLPDHRLHSRAHSLRSLDSLLGHSPSLFPSQFCDDEVNA